MQLYRGLVQKGGFGIHRVKLRRPPLREFLYTLSKSLFELPILCHPELIKKTLIACFEIHRKERGKVQGDNCSSPWLKFIPAQALRGGGLCGFPTGKHHPDLFPGVESEATIISCHSKLKTQARPSKERA